MNLQHRRTIILFNELHSTEDVVSFTDWLSPDVDWSLWDRGHESMKNTDDEGTALRFIQNFVYRAWSGVDLKWDILLRCAEEHLASVVRIFYLFIKLHPLNKRNLGLTYHSGRRIGSGFFDK